ncbi:MAG: methyltransferase domain-containing protein [Holophaga sp.]|jgi:SAM-dependent methyltransferase
MTLDYDVMAASYARHRRIHPGVLKGLVEHGALSGAARVLDVGCGTGNYMAALEQAAGCEVWGLEPSEGMRAKALAQFPRARVREGQAERLEFPEAWFDLVFSVDVIHHVADRAAHYREAFRVLKPGGRACTVTDSEDVIRRRVPLSSHFPETVAVELKRYPRIADLRAMMAAAGFTGLEEETVELQYPLRDLQSYRDQAFSSLHLIPPEALRDGLARLERELEEKGFVQARSLYTLLWGTKAGAPR